VQPLSDLLQAVPDQASVLVVAEHVDRGLCLLEVLASTGQIAQPAVALAHVQVQ
jgi:hypothetical protein